MRLSLHGSSVFKLNKYLSVRFRKGETIIYVKREPFIACKYLFMNAPIDSISSFASIDQMSEQLNGQLERELTREDVGLLPKEEFRGHCSNLHAWVEYDYDTCLLHRNLAFPLLKELANVGDAQAEEMFSLEVIRRFKSRYPTVQKYLILEEYLKPLTHTVLEELIDHVDDKDALRFLSRYFSDKDDFSNHLKVLKRLIWLDPIDRKAYLVLAFTYLRTSKLLREKLVLKQFLEMYPKDEDALRFLASLYHFRGKVDKAKTITKKLNLAEFSFLSRKKFVALNLYEFSSLIPKQRRLRRPHKPQWLMDIP